MRFTGALFALAQTAMLAACAVSPPRSPVGDRPAAEAQRPVGPATAPMTPAARTHRPGVGIVESASVVSLSSSPSAAAGGTGTSAPTMAYRVQMPDGATQSVVQAGERFAVGDRVEVTGDGRLIRP